MGNHNASPQMLGYLFQVRCALDLLLSADNEQSGICLEKFDDIAFSNNNENPNVLIQTKHHVNKRGDLTDASVDLWRTLNVWIDVVEQKKVSNSKYIIITTANAPEESVSYYLRIADRDTNRAYSILKTTAEKSTSESNQKYYTAFLGIKPELMQEILDDITIIDMSANILNIESGIKKSIRYASRPELLLRCYQRGEFSIRTRENNIKTSTDD